MPGRNCKPGKGYKDNRGFWHVRCKCGAVSPPFKVKALAHRWHRQHKNDDPNSYPEPIKQAILNLDDVGLLQGDYAGILTGTK